MAQTNTLNLYTVQQFADDVRALLLDKIQPFRYSDTDIVRGLNLALLEGRRLRPDLFVCRYGNSVPEFDAVTGDIVPIEPQFKQAFVYGIAAHTLMRDEEDVQDARAEMFRGYFEDMLVGVRQRPTPQSTGTPQPQNVKG